MVKDKKDYLSFDKFIRSSVENGEISVDMSDTQLKEALKDLGIRRVRTYYPNEQRYETLNAYPKPKQISHVKEVMQEDFDSQKRIEDFRMKAKSNKKV